MAASLNNSLEKGSGFSSFGAGLKWSLTFVC